MRISQRLGIVLGLGLAAVIMSSLRSERQRKTENQEKSQTKERLNVWDNEGGNIPSVQTVRPIPEDPTALH